MDSKLEKDPHICVKVWKSSGWVTISRFIPFVLGPLLIFFALIVFNEGREKDMGNGMLMLVLGTVFLLSFFLIRLAGKEMFCIGVDFSADTLWVYRNRKGVISRLSGATEIVHFGIRIGDAKKSFAYQLAFSTKDEPNVPNLTGAALYTKSDAKKAAHGANEFFEIGL